MKKILALILTLVMVLSFAACAADNGGTNSDDPNNPGVDLNTPEDPVKMLDEIWAKYGDDEKFAVAGGDFSEENANMEGPGRYSISDAEALDAVLGFPAASIDKIEDAASLMHMMNANTFTCGAYKVKDAADTADLASAVETNIQARQWMCGFPDKVIVATLGSYLVSAFGNGEIIDIFKAKITEAYPEAQIIYDNPIV